MTTQVNNVDSSNIIMESVSTILYPALRLLVAGFSVWLSAAGSK
jgi:hypothetical protein